VCRRGRKGEEGRGGVSPTLHGDSRYWGLKGGGADALVCVWEVEGEFVFAGTKQYDDGGQA